MAFLGNDPLSELVWSPRKGLVLRPADGSIPEGKSSDFSGAGYSEMGHPPPPCSIATESSNDNVTKERNLIVLPTTISPVEKDVADEPAILLTASKNFASNMQVCKSDIGCDPESGEKTTEMNTSSQKSYARDSTARFEATGSNSQGLEDGRTSNAMRPVSDELDLNIKPAEYMPCGSTDMEMCDPLDTNKDNSQTCPLPPPTRGNFLQEVQDLRKSNVADVLMPNPSSSRPKELVRSNNCLMKDGEDKMTDTVSAKYKWQSPSDSDLGIRNSSQGRKEQLQLEACPVSKASPIKYFAAKRIGKEHAISGGSIREQDSASYGSVNSCNTAGLLGARKKRELSFEEQLLAGSKRVKLDIQETPGSTSFNRSDGSFVNWISTLMKGRLSRPNENKAPSLADASNGSEKKELVQYNKCGNMGFQSIFESLYQPNSKGLDQRLSGSVDPYASEGCKELEAVEKSIDNNNNVRTYCPDDCVDLEQKGLSNESLNQCMVGDWRDLLDCKTSASPKRFSPTQNCAMAEHVGCSKNLTVGKWKIDDDCKGDFSGLSLEEKKVDESVKKYSQHSHLWLTHFCPKSSGLITNVANRERRTAGVAESSADLSRFGHNRQDKVACFMDSKDTASQGHSSKGPTSSFCKTLHGSFLEAEASFARIEGRRVSPIKPSSRFMSSEAMVSMFAKRLDSLKQIMLPDMADKGTSSATTCFFCGVIGHGLRDCPQVTDTEVDALIDDVTARSGAEESPRFCIRCFQLNHWAAACPHAPTAKESQLEHVAAVLNRTFLAETSHLEMPGGTHGQTGIPGLKASCSSSRHRVSTDLDVNSQINEASASLRRSFPNLGKFSPSCAEESASEAPCLPRPYFSFGRQVADKPRGIFEAVKSLRLSRTDILKYMYSMVPISYLDGYYLRLRLGKPGEGIEGTGYHVACISDLHGDKSVETSKRPISVIVGGVRCSVESQYISNRDFLEDELTAWWSGTIKGGGEIPLEEELRSKVEERRSLGL